MSPAGKSRLPTPTSRNSGSPGAAAIGAAPRASTGSTSSLPSIRSFRKAFQFSTGTSKNPSLSNGPLRQGSMASAGSNASLSSTLGSPTSEFRGSESFKATEGAEGSSNNPASYSVAGRAISPPFMMVQGVLPRPSNAPPVTRRQLSDGSGQAIGFGSRVYTSQTSLLEQASHGDSGDETLVPPNPITDLPPRQASTPPPTMPLPPVPHDIQDTVPLGDENTKQAASMDDQLRQAGRGEQQDTYTFPYTIAPTSAAREDAKNDISLTVLQSPQDIARERQYSNSAPILLDSPARSPVAVDGDRHFDDFSQGTLSQVTSPDAINALSSSWSQRSVSRNGDEAELESSLSRLRHSASSPLSELVARLSMSSPDKMKRSISGENAQSPTEEMDLASLRGEDESDTADGHAPFTSPFIPQESYNAEDSQSVADEGSVDGSSGISVASATQHGDLTMRPGVEAAHREAPATATQVDGRLPDVQQERISPKTEKRWSMLEVEAAYARMRSLATSRKGSGATDAPSFVLSDDSKEFETSFMKQLLENADADTASVLDMSQLGTPRAKLSIPDSNAEEATDSLTPLMNEGRYSPMNSPHLSGRSASPIQRGVSTSPLQRSPVIAAKSDESSIGKRSMAVSTNGDAPSHKAALATLCSSRETTRISKAATPKRRYSDRSEVRSNGLGIDTRRRMSEEVSVAAASSVGSDDTGWVTPKTSLGDAISRRRSVSPNLAGSHRRSSSSTEHYDDLPHRVPGAYRTRRPVSYSSATSTESGLHAGHRRSASLRQNGLIGRPSSSNFWIEETPKGIYRHRPGIPNGFRPEERSARSREPSNTGSTYSLDNSSTVSLADAKRVDKLELFLRCTKAEAAYNNLLAQHNIEKEALLDAVQEYKANAMHQRQHSEALEDEIESLRHDSGRKQWHAQIAEMVEARDTWQGRAQQAERELKTAQTVAAEKERRSDTTIAELRRQIAALQAQIQAAKTVKASPKAKGNESIQTGLPRSRHSSGGSPKVATTSPTTHIPRSGSGLRKLASGLPRSRHTSNSSGSAIFRHGRAESTASSTLDTDFGDHLPPASDGWSANDSFDASLHLDEQTARFLQDMDDVSVRSRQASK